VKEAAEREAAAKARAERLDATRREAQELEERRRVRCPGRVSSASYLADAEAQA